MKKMNIIAMISMILLASFTQACKKDVARVIWTGEEDPYVPEEIVPGKDALVWIDAQSNIFQAPGKFRDKEEIKAILDKAQDVGITGLVVDVKHNTGYTLYESQYAGKLSSLGGLNALDDYVEFMVAEAKSRNLKIYLAMNTFVWGNTSRQMGVVYDDADFAQYESILCDVNGNRVTASEFGINSFMNPAAAPVQERALNVIREMAGKFDVDGIVLDYCRYRAINADFSDLSKELFIQFLEEKYSDNEARHMRFPEDIVGSWSGTGTSIQPASTGKYYKKWLYFRASVLKDFMTKAKAAVKGVDPDMELGAYSGGWYSSYYEVGVNWASEDYDPFYDEELTFNWAYPGYKETGYAEQLDMFMTGNYFRQLYLADNPATAHLKYHWWSVEGSLNGAEYITRNKVPLYGSLDVGNTAYENEAEISASIQYILNRTSGGFMLFDLVHVYVPGYNNLNMELWDAVEAGLKE